MRPVTFSTDPLRQFLRGNRIATLPQLKQVLGTDADITVFRKLKELLGTVGHRGRVEDWRGVPRSSLSVGSPFPLGVPH